MAIEKLRGFVADHEANILKIDGNQIQLEIAEKCDSRLRRLTDRPVTFQLDLRFEEQRVRRERDHGEVNTGGVLRTRIFVSITPRKTRDRRRADVAERAQQVLISFRSYLMATLGRPRRPAAGRRAGEDEARPAAVAEQEVEWRTAIASPIVRAAPCGRS